MGIPPEPARLSEEPTDPTIPGPDRPLDDATSPGFRDEPTSPTGFRDEPTAPAGTRTVKLEPPWMTAPDPLPRETRPRDPLMMPALVFVAVLAASIVYMVFVQPAKHAPRAPSFSTSE